MPGRESSDTRCGASRWLSAAWMVAAAFMLCLIFVGSAQAACPLGQVPQGPGGTCVCPTGTAPQVPGGACMCANGTVPSPLGCEALPGCQPGQQLPGGQGCCAPNTTRQGDICVANLCEPGELRLPNNTCYPNPAAIGSNCVVPPPTVTQILNALFAGISFTPPNFCCPSDQMPAMTYGPPVGNPPLINIVYTRACCPFGQVPQINGSCVPQQPPPGPDAPKCPGGAPVIPGVGTCCPAGTWAVTNTLACCPKGRYPRPNGSCGCPLADAEVNGACEPACDSTSHPIWNPVTGDLAGCQTCPGNQVSFPGGGCCVPTDPPGGCCPVDQQNTNGVCCPSGTHPEGASCARGDKHARPRPTPVMVPICHDGRVPREAFDGDLVCVTRLVRDQVIADNNAAPTRIKPDGTCIRGYVWREARADDHVCVTPPTRTQTRQDNAGTADNNCPPGGSCASPPPACPRGYVRRDGVCRPEKGFRPPQTRIPATSRWHRGEPTQTKPRPHPHPVPHPPPRHAPDRGRDR